MHTFRLTPTVQRILVVAVLAIFLVSVVGLQGADASYLFTYWWMFPIAFAIALIVNTVGVSGAALYVPFFVLVFPLLAPPLSAIESVKLGLITESFGLASSALAFIAYGLTDSTIAGRSILVALPFVIVGAFVVTFIPEAVLFLIIAGLLIVSVVMLFTEEHLRAKRRKEHGSDVVHELQDEGDRVTRTTIAGKTYRYHRTRRGFVTRAAGYSIGGFFQGSAGFGIGELGIVSMIMSGIPTRIAIGTSHLVVAGTAIVAASIHIATQDISGAGMQWNIVFMSVPAVVLGGQLAPYVAAKLPTKTLEQIVAVLFIGIAIALIGLAVHAW